MKIPEHSNGQALEGNLTVTEGAPRVATGNTTSLPAGGSQHPLSELGVAALSLARQGLFVLPCEPRGKAPLTTHGVKDATTDEAQIREWWTAWPNANPAVACGASGLVVLDDDQAGEFERLCADQGQPVPATFKVTTAKGAHHWFRQPSGQRIGNPKAFRQADYLIDVRGDGGYVIAPGAIHETGATYTGSETASDLTRLPEVPSWVAGMVSVAGRQASAPVREAGRHAAFARELAAVFHAKPGERNNRLNEAAYNLGQLAGPGGLDEALVRAVLTEAGQHSGLDPQEVAATVESGVRSGQVNARPVSAADDPDRLEADVAAELRRIEVRETARARWRAAQDPHLTGFDAGTLGELLGREPEPRPRVEGLIPWEASTLISAQRKTGKTTLVLNLAKALLTGEAFLGFDTAPVAGKVALLNFEVSGFQIARWANEILVPHDRLVLVNLRGRRNALADERDREALAEMLRAHRVESLIVDPFGRAFSGESQNDAGQVGRFLVDLDRFARSMVQARDLILTAHAGWNGERTRGSSALEDWADVIVTMTRSESNTNPARFLRATGRDVDLDEDQLEFDPDTRTLTLTGQGSRKQQQRRATSDTKVDEQVERVVAVLTHQPGLSVRELREVLRGTSRAVIDAAVGEAQERGLVRTERVGNATKHFLVTPQEVLPNA